MTILSIFLLRKLVEWLLGSDKLWDMVPVKYAMDTFGRDLLKTTLGYIKWGYGALLVSFIVYAGWRLSAQLALSNRDCVLLGALLLTCVTLFVNLWRVREWHEKQMLVSMFIVQSLSEISPQERANLHKGLLQFLDAQVKKNGRATAQLIEQLNQK